MAYMKDSTGRRLDSFAVAGLTETLPRHSTIIPLGTSFTEGNYGPGTVNPLRYQHRGYFNWAMAFPHASAGHPSGTTSLMLQLNVNGLDTITVEAGRAKVFKVT